MDSMDADTQAGQLEDLEPDEESQMMMAAAQGQKETEDQQLIQREREKDRDVAQPQRMLPLQICASKQRKFATQRSILKNSQERTYVEENEVLEAKKQLILRRRRLFSHYRQYDQWRRRQFSYDPSYFRPPPLLPRPLACAADYTAAASTMYSGTGAGIGASIGQSNHHAGRRRRQYRRQYSCADRSRDGSRESGGSSNLQLQATQKYHSMVASDTIHTDSSMLNHSNYSEPASHIHMLAEEHSTSISERCTRSRINSAIFVSSEGRGFDSIEFLRRHGSQSVLCRKAKSAENITDNGRKKSLRQWRTDPEDSVKQQHLSQDSNDIELKECGELLRLPVVQAIDSKQSPTAVTSLLARSAAITTANVIVGSISLEAPPPYMQDDDADTPATAALLASAIVHDSQDSAETVEELVHVPLLASATATATVSAASSTPSIAIEAKPRVLVHQRSSTASSSPHSSPKNLGLGLKIVKPKISGVPMVSVSGPSPPIEKPPLAECL